MRIPTPPNVSLQPESPVILTPALPSGNSSSGISVRIARTQADLEKALQVRWLGYKKYESFSQPEMEELDHGTNCTILFAEDLEKNPLGTLRILDHRRGPIELQKFLNVDELLPQTGSIAEATRFSVPRSARSPRVKLLLWKAFYLFCVQRKIDYMVVSMRPAAAGDYQRLQFTRAEGGCYSHATLGNLPHETYYLHVPTAPQVFRLHNNTLLSFFTETIHPEIDLAFE